ncbi:phosphoheptose isomerase [Robbsia andropogonis]
MQYAAPYPRDAGHNRCNVASDKKRTANARGAARMHGAATCGIRRFESEGGADVMARVAEVARTRQRCRRKQDRARVLCGNCGGMSIESIQNQFSESATAQRAALDVLAHGICAAVDTLFTALVNSHKVLVCGDGGSAALADHFARQLVDRYERERPGLAALSLSTSASLLQTVGGLSDIDQLFAKQVQALGQPGDVLLAISADGNADSVMASVVAAHERGMLVVALTGCDGGAMLDLLSDTDIHLSVSTQRLARVHEIHLLTIHCLCDGIDEMLLGEA